MVPAGPQERLHAALRRSLELLGSGFLVQAAALRDADTVWALAVVLGVWIELQVLPSGWLRQEIEQTIAPARNLEQTRPIVRAAQQAAAAGTEEAMESSSRALMQALAMVGPAQLQAMLASADFQRIRNHVREGFPPKGPEAPASAVKPGPSRTQPQGAVAMADTYGPDNPDGYDDQSGANGPPDLTKGETSADYGWGYGPPDITKGETAADYGWKDVPLQGLPDWTKVATTAIDTAGKVARTAIDTAGRTSTGSTPTGTAGGSTPSKKDNGGTTRVATPATPPPTTPPALPSSASGSSASPLKLVGIGLLALGGLVAVGSLGSSSKRGRAGTVI